MTVRTINAALARLLETGADVDMKEVELDSWRRATVIVVISALVVFFSQRFVVQAFDIAFEICVFYVPALTLVILYVYFKNKLGGSPS